MRLLVRLSVVAAVLVLGALAAAVEPEEANAWRGVNPVKLAGEWGEVWEYVVDGEPKVHDGGTRGPGGPAVWNRIRQRLGKFPPRFTGVMRVGTGPAVGGYVAWKMCDDFVLDECDFLGLRDTVGNWGETTTRTTFTTSGYQWIYNGGDDYWYLQPTTGPSLTYGPAYYMERSFDSGATWSRNAASAGDCSGSPPGNDCHYATVERHDVFATAVRGELNVTVVTPNVKRVVSRRILDADFQELLVNEGIYLPVVPNTTDWPNQTTTNHPKMSPELPEFEGDEWEVVQEEIETLPVEGTESQTEVGEELDPTWEGPALGFTMPDCYGFTLAECEAALDALGHTGTRTVIVQDFAGADVTQPADAVVNTFPSGATVDTPFAETVEIFINPAEEDMPIELPEPLPGETYAAWLVRLQALGYVGTVTLVTLSEELGVPELGPSAPVTFRIPAIGTTPIVTINLPGGWTVPGPRVAPNTDIEVWNNPTTYPPVDPSTVPPPTGGPPGGVPGLDFTPVTGIDWGCKFPFGFICYATDVTGWFNVAADAPVFTLAIPAVDVLGTSYDCDCDYEVDLSNMDGYMSLIRGLMSVAMWVGAVYFLATRLLGFNAGGDPGEAVDEGFTT